MTDPDGPLSALLSDTLHGRVDHQQLPSTPMGEIVTAARHLQRRRRLRNGVVAAAVVAVLATPFVLDAARHPGTSPVPTDPVPTDPAPTEPSTAAPLRVRLADVALGKPPAIAWIDGSDYVAADGTRTTLPVDQISAATPYGGGFLVAAFGDSHVTLLDSRLREVWRRCAAIPRLAASEDGLRTAYSAGDCGGSDGTLHFGPTDGTEERSVPMRLATGGPVGFVGDAVVLSSYNDGPPVLVDADGTPTRIDALKFVTGVDDRLGLVSGQPTGRGGVPSAAGAVVDPRTGAVKWQVRDWNLYAFSPDGSMVVGAQSDTRSLGVGFAIFDAETGEKLHEFALPQHFQADRVAWEDDEHLLMAATKIHAQAILRTTLDGAIQRATETAPYDPEGQRFGLAPNLLQ
jgi:hypothetical protein